MKTLALTAAIVTALAAPAFAQHNPAAQTIFLSEAISDDERTISRGIGAPEIVSTQSFGTGSQAQAIFLVEAVSDDDSPFSTRPGGIEILSTQSFGANAVAERIFAAEHAASQEDE